MKKTPEEKERARIERIERRNRELEKYPGCHYSVGSGSMLQLICQDGSHWPGVTVRTNNLRLFKPSTIGGEQNWVEANIRLDDIYGVAQLVAALMARLNGLIESANLEVAAIKPPKALDHPVVDHAPDSTERQP